MSKNILIALFLTFVTVASAGAADRDTSQIVTAASDSSNESVGETAGIGAT